MKKIIFSFFLLSVQLSIAQLPTFQWSKGMGGGAYDGASSVVLDANGNVYTIGSFGGTVDFDPGTPVYNLTSAGNQDIFISKLDASGNFLWAKKIGGMYNDAGISCDIDPSGNIYITGSFNGTVDFDPGPGISNVTSIGVDIFIMKINGGGNLVWVKTIGGNDYQQSKYLTVDGTGNIYITGTFESMKDFDPDAGTMNLTAVGGTDIFILKLNTSGNLVWAKNFGGTSTDIGYAIAVDASGNVYSTGYFRGVADFDPGTGINNISSSSLSDNDIFISKLNASGNFVWAKQIGSTGDDRGIALSIDQSGDIYTAGSFSGTVDFDPGSGVSNLSTTSSSAFILKLNPLGNFIFANNFQGVYTSQFSIKTDLYNQLYFAGRFYEATIDFDPGPGVNNLSYLNGVLFIAKFDQNSTLQFATNFGCTSACSISSIISDASGNIYSAGNFSGNCDFDPGIASTTLTSNGFTDILIHKMTQSGVGIQENNINQNINLYPNPTHGIINIKSENLNSSTKVQLINTLGKIILEEYINPNKPDINIQYLSSGIYFLKFISEDKLLSTQKIIKE